MRYWLKWLLLVATPCVALSAVSEERAAVNLNAYSQIEIDRPVATVWPYIVDTNSWKPERRLTHRSGPVGQVGEVLAIVGPTGKVWFLVENVELVANQRRTIKMYDPDGKLLGFATWKLQATGDHTLIEYEIHGESLVAAAQAGQPGGKSVAEQEREGYAVNKKRIDVEFAALKRLLEAK